MEEGAAAAQRDGSARGGSSVRRELTLSTHPRRPSDVMEDPEGINTIPATLLDPVTVNGVKTCCF
ncbi:hypothetical protein HK405_008083, partial [Cladochytrium tenue]